MVLNQDGLRTGRRGMSRGRHQAVGWIARRIVEEAKLHGIPLREDPLLVEALMGLDLYQEIPEELYQVVAEIYVFLYQVRNEAFSSG